MVHRPIRVRKMDFPFDEGIPRYWMGDCATFTHALNGLHLLFPEGERFFMRSVRHYMPQISDPKLIERVSGFYGQEARHGLEHERTFDQLRAHGYEIDGFLAWYKKWAYEGLEQRSPPIMCLSATVALEHLTAVMAHHALTHDHLDNAHPVMRDLLLWHACEEIEHKSVAFDVFTAVGGTWAIRAAGMAMVFPMLLWMWDKAGAELLAQDNLTQAELQADRQKMKGLGSDRRYLIGAVLNYMRPGFHPDQIDDYDLAEAWLTKVGRLDA